MDGKATPSGARGVGACAVIPDHCTEAGARALARRIQQYWAERGYMPPVIRYESASDAWKNNGSSFHFVRSDMVGGLPRRRLGQG